MAGREQIILYSHGFGVRYDARGMFTAIAQRLPHAQHVMFDYNQIDEGRNSLTVPSVSTQVAIFQQKLNKIKETHPKATITVVAHSFGCVIAGLAGVEGVRKIILITPPVNLAKSAKRLGLLSLPRLRFTIKGRITLKRRDGVTVVISPAYRKQRRTIQAVEAYKQMAKTADITVIGATQDRLLNNENFAALAPFARIVWVEGGHNFMKKNARAEFAATVAKIISR